MFLGTMEKIKGFKTPREQHLVQCLGIQNYFPFFIALRAVKSSTPPLSPAICSIISHSTTSQDLLGALEKQQPNDNHRSV